MSNINLFTKLEGKIIEQYRIFQPRLATLREPQYHLEKLVGVGGYGGVYRAVQIKDDIPLSEKVAVKLIEVNRNDVNQLNELAAATSFSHINLMKCDIAGDWKIDKDEFLFLVMKLAESSLLSKIQSNKLSVAETKQMVIEIAKGLNHLHSQGKIHRDLKSGNVLRVGDTWKISDFGLIRDMGENDYVRSATVGTFAYMSPETFQSITSPAWDIWSLGIMIVEALTQNLPYQFKTPPELMYQVMQGNLIIPQLPAPFDTIVQGCLQKEYRERWTAQRVIDALTPRQGSRFEVPFTPSPAQAISQPRVQSRDLVLTLPKNQKLELVEIPSGRLVMEGGHEIRLNGFRMGKYPITQGQYEAVMGSNPSGFKGNDRCPVENVSWNDVVEFCQKVSQQTGQQVRLPSETEWEYACRAGTTTRYYFGDNENDLDRYGWYDDNSGSKTHPVGEKQPNGWGLYDMHGNVWEWGADVWTENVSEIPKNGSPFSGGDSSRRILRGGSWGNDADLCRSAYRYGPYADYRYDLIGFRVVVVSFP